jgi:ABC-type multidrug transport system ATPase subunit
VDRLPATGDCNASAFVIEFRNVGKIYRSLLGNSVKAVEEFSLQIGEGEILGIAGPNGAGKSTLIAMLLGFLRPTTGEVEIDGLRSRTYVQRHGIGYLSELIAIPPRWRTDTSLVRYSTLAGIPAGQIGARVDGLLQQLGLTEHRGKKVKALSKGNLQRLGLAQALIRDERILVLDEPTHGLDPVWTQKFRDIVEGLRRPDRIIVIASHNLDELQRLASGFDQIGIAFPGAEEIGPGEYNVSVSSIQGLNSALADLIGRGALVASVVPERSALEQQFREAVGESQ